MATVVLLGTLDTKGPEYAFLRRRIEATGCTVIVVDAGIGATGEPADIGPDEVARAAGVDRAALAAAGDRGHAIAAMTRGATAVVGRLRAEGRLDAILGLGGSGGSSLVGAAMQALPVGVPKLLVSTMASGDTRPYVGTTDVTVMHSVVDLAGINRVSERILDNAAAAVAAMAQAAAAFVSRSPGRPVVGATMYGNTTPGVTAARETLQLLGYEVLVFHANGTGGRAMEALVREGVIDAVLDATTTELVDEVVGGVCSAGPDRLTAAAERGLPQVVSLGALDMVNFGPIDTVPPRFRDRTLYRHNAAVTLMRATALESAEVGRILARKLNATIGPLAVFIPTAGLSMLDVPGWPFYDPGADAALVGELKTGLRPDITVVELATDINDPAFGRAMAQRLDELYGSWAASRSRERQEELHGAAQMTTAATAAH